MPNQIQPIKNYNTEVECNDAMDILILRALRQILRYSQDYLEDKIAMRKESQSLFTEEAAKMMRVTLEKKLIGARGVVLAVGDILEQVEPPDEDGLVSVKTASGETGVIKSKYLGQYTVQSSKV